MTTRLNYNQFSGEAVKGLMTIENYLKNSSIEHSLLGLVKIRVSQMNLCAFCLDMHIKEARMRGEKELRLHHLAVWSESPLFEKRERIALEWAEILTQMGAHGVSDEQFQKVREHFSEQETSDLTFAVVSINAWNRLGVAYRPTPGGMDKAFGLDKSGLS